MIAGCDVWRMEFLGVNISLISRLAPYWAPVDLLCL